MFRIIGFGIVLFCWIILINAFRRIIRISNAKKSYPTNGYSYKYDPYILDKITDPNSGLDMMAYHYKTNIEGSSLKKLAIMDDLSKEEISIDFQKVEG